MHDTHHLLRNTGRKLIVTKIAAKDRHLQAFYPTDA